MARLLFSLLLGILAVVPPAPASAQDTAPATSTPPGGLAQKKSGIAFWELDPAPVDAALRLNPKKDRERYSFLKRSFANFECTGDRIFEQRVSKHDANLICTLPGESPDPIIVAARYDHNGDGWPTWGDTVMLPLLYHALSAQPRHHTFVFAALYGYIGEKTFFDWLKRPGATPPGVNIVIESMGMGEPRCHTVPFKKSVDAKADSSINRILCDEALATRQLMGLSAAEVAANLTGPYVNFVFTHRATLFDSDLYRRARSAPSALLYSDVGFHATPEPFHQDFDFSAWVLCEIDRKLTSEEQAAAR